MDIRTWKIDETHTHIGFAVRHLIVAIARGRFRQFTAEVAIDESDLAASRVHATIDAASIDTGNSDRDADLRSERFFSAAQHPTITFHSTSVVPIGKTTCRVIGDLTLKGVTKELALEVEVGGFVVDPWGHRRAGFTVTGSLLRSDFGIVWNQTLDAGGLALGDRVDLEIAVEAVASSTKAA
jgi:polyisoprenoid-binding protein YceI